MTAIPDLDQWLLKVMDGLPRSPRRYELRCHPDVYLAILQAAPEPEYSPSPGMNTGSSAAMFGSADVVVRTELGSGGWELYEDGELLKAGRLGEAA